MRKFYHQKILRGSVLEKSFSLTFSQVHVLFEPMPFNFENNKSRVLTILAEVSATKNLTWPKLRSILNKYPRDGKAIFSKENLVFAYRKLKEENHPNLPNDTDLLQKIQMKPIRTQSGVTPVTVLTKPFPCPGQCIFCPNDVRMPKSYLSDEPGAQRAEKNNFDPYLQTYRRIASLHAIGHNVDKIEIIILGGTWSFYPESYQIWFVKRIFEAMNDFGEGKNQTEETEKIAKKAKIPEHFDKNFLSKLKPENDTNANLHEKYEANEKSFENFNLNISERVKVRAKLSGNQVVNLAENIIKNDEAKKSETKVTTSSYNQAISKIIHEAGQKMISPKESATWEELEFEQKRNETTLCRCVGLVIETRPDHISPKEVIRIRRLGCTKAQIGFQSLNDEVLEKNHRGHNVAATRYAVKLLRLAGFKIHGHWMANLYGSNVEADIQDFEKLFGDPDFCPDELKLYPCSLLETAELMDYYKDGRWSPYNHDELLKVVSTAIGLTPPYCRLTRVVRDIPSTDIVAGNKFTNFREIAEKELDKMNIPRKDIRSREIKNRRVRLEDLQLEIVKYPTSAGMDYFLQFVTEDYKIAGFLRLCLPNYSEEKAKNRKPDILNNQKIATKQNILKNADSSANNAKKNTGNQTEISTQNEDTNKIFYTRSDQKNSNFQHPFLPELSDSSIIREIHIYGKAVSIGDKDKGKAQHLGLGTKLIAKAKEISSQFGYKKMSVISAIGTREYYRKRGFLDDGLYLSMIL